MSLTDNHHKNITPKRMLNRPSNPELERYITDVSWLCNKYRDVGIQMIDTLGNERERSKLNINVPVTYMLRSYVEYLDTISCLFEKGIVVSAMPSIRTLYEVALGLLYILQDDQERRALSYRYGSLLQRKKYFDQLDCESEVGRKFTIDTGIKRDDSLEWREESQKIRKEMSKIPFKDVVKEWNNQVKKQKRKHVQWYSLWSGYKTLRMLAEGISHLASYRTLYDLWSHEAHGASAFDAMDYTSDGNEVIKPFRNPTHMPQMIRLIAMLTRQVFAEIGEFFFDEEEQGRLATDLTVLLVFEDEMITASISEQYKEMDA